MKLNCMLVATAALSAITVAAPATAASLVGTTVSTNLSVGATDLGTRTSVVGAGEEGNFFNNQFFDYGATSFAIRSTTAFSGGIDASSNRVSLTLSNLNLGTPITGVSFTSLLTGVTSSFTANSVTFNWTNQALPASTYISSTFATAPAVPEPASWAMMILGMGAVGGALRRRSKVSTTVKFA